MTPIQREVLAFIQASPLRGPALTRALAQARGCRISTADHAIQRLIRKGVVAPDGNLAPIRQLLREVGQFLAVVQVSSGDHERVMRFRERILELGG